ncbi:YjiH family protein [Vallitalea okinawensis]|uniref:YjiH family protein n=1 Tax=Vallitalea okinawensis TaxID=2078660 RepID=UPI000CFBD802|nr:YjiH family protein [Vallitalea okinawensis]
MIKKGLLKFLIPSLLGVVLFMTPISYEGHIIIPVAIFSNFIQGWLADSLPSILTMIITFSCIISIYTKILKPNFIINNPFLNALFNPSKIWMVARVLGSIFVICTLYNVGPDFIGSENTGGLLLYDLLPVLFAVFLFAGMLLPLLLNFGLLEFVGSLLTKVMRPVFKLPGRSSVDCIASWLGDGTIGVLLTSKQYEEGYYTKREAAVIGTTFSFVSITFSLVVIAQVGLENLFIPYYLTILLCGIVAAIIIPRIPPLSRKADVYISGEKNEYKELIPEGYTSFSWGLEKAIARSSKSKGVKEFILQGSMNVLDMWIGVIPIVMAMGTFTLILAEYTPLFKYLGMPFIPLLLLLQVPEAVEASQTLIVGFADMFLPSVMAASIENEMTRFIIATTSVTQLIYMSEVGGLILGSKIPVNFKELFVIFLERTLITLPIIVIVAHIIF